MTAVSGMCQRVWRQCFVVRQCVGYNGLGCSHSGVVCWRLLCGIPHAATPHARITLVYAQATL